VRLLGLTVSSLVPADGPRQLVLPLYDSPVAAEP
jgi:hypothetical protein